MGRIGPWEIAVVVIAIIVLFGHKKLPEIGRAIGKALKEFKKAGKEFQDEIKESVEENDDESKK